MNELERFTMQQLFLTALIARSPNAEEILDDVRHLGLVICNDPAEGLDPDRFGPALLQTIESIESRRDEVSR